MGNRARMALGVSGLVLAACSESTPPRPPLVFTALSAGNGHACGLTTDGAAYCWGFSDYGGLGNGTTADITTTPAVASSDARRVARDASPGSAPRSGLAAC